MRHLKSRITISTALRGDQEAERVGLTRRTSLRALAVLDRICCLSYEERDVIESFRTDPA